VVTKKLKSRKNSGNFRYHSVQNTLHSCLLSEKIRKVYSLENTNIPKVFFTPHYVGHCCTVIRGHYCTLSHSCSVVLGHCCATMCSNNGLSSQDSSTPKMKTVCFTETLVSTYQLRQMHVIFELIL
jgi:hypothetical protein